MPHRYRRGFYQPQAGKGFFGFGQSYLPAGKGIGGIGGKCITVIDDQSADTEADSAMNMTKDVLQGNTLNEEVDIPVPSKKRKLDPPNRESKKPKLDLKTFVKQHQSVKF